MTNVNRQVIQSLDNRIFKSCKDLLQRKHRKKQGQYMVEGEKLVLEGLAVGRVNTVILREGCLQDLDKYHSTEGPNVYLMGDKLFDQLVQTETDQGVIGIVSIVEPTKEQFREAIGKGRGNILVMDALQDPGNIGTIIRTAVAAGYVGIIAVKGTGDIYSPKVVRAASGGLLSMAIITDLTYEEALEIIKYCNKRPIGTAPAGAIDYYQVDLSKDCALIIGNEGNGMSEDFLNNIDINVKIPMEGAMESLNAAVAAGILMYQGIEKG